MYFFVSRLFCWISRSLSCSLCQFCMFCRSNCWLDLDHHMDRSTSERVFLFPNFHQFWRMYVFMFVSNKSLGHKALTYIQKNIICSKPSFLGLQHVNFHRVFRVCVSVYHISWIYIPHSRCHHFCLGGTTSKGRTPWSARSSPSTSSLDIGSWKFKSFRRGSLGRRGPSRVREGGRLGVGVGVKVCFVVFFGREIWL